MHICTLSESFFPHLYSLVSSILNSVVAVQSIAIVFFFASLSGGAFNGTITTILSTPLFLIYRSAAVHAHLALPDLRVLLMSLSGQ